MSACLYLSIIFDNLFCSLVIATPKQCIFKALQLKFQITFQNSTKIQTCRHPFSIIFRSFESIGAKLGELFWVPQSSFFGLSNYTLKPKFPPPKTTIPYQILGHIFQPNYWFNFLYQSVQAININQLATMNPALIGRPLIRVLVIRLRTMITCISVHFPAIYGILQAGESTTTRVAPGGHRHKNPNTKNEFLVGNIV